MRKFFRSAFRRLGTALISPHALTLLLGSAAGAMLLSWCFQWTARLGTSLAVQSALGLAVVAGLELGFRPFKSTLSPKTLFWLMLGGQGFLTAWTLGFAWFLDWQTTLLGAFAPTQLANPGLALAVLFGCGLVLVSPAVFVLARIPFCLIAKTRAVMTPRASTACFFAGMAAGVLLSTFVLAPRFGLLTNNMLFGFSALFATAVGFSRRSPIEDIRANPEDISESLNSGLWEQHGREFGAAFMLLCVGVGFAWVSRAVDQLMPAVLSLACAKWSALLLGWALGFSWKRRTRETGQANHAGLLCSFFLGAWVVFVAAAFPWLIDVCLRLTVTVSSVFLLSSCRLGLLMLLIAPLGFGWGRISAFAFQTDQAKPRGDRSPAAMPGIPLLTAAFLAGWLLSQWVLIPAASMAATLIGLALVVLLLCLLRLVLETNRPEGWKSRAAMAACGCMMLTSFFSSRHYCPQTSARLLFAAPVFVAQQSGLDSELLTALDEGRLLDTVEGQQGTYTLWKYRGVQYQLRQCGLPSGMASGNSVMCPDYSAEVLPVAMPLTLHEHPGTILILGIGSGVAVNSALAFPTQAVTCVESDPALIALVKDQILARQDDSAVDPRLTILPIDPALLLRSKLEQFDVIVSLPNQAVLSQSVPYFTEAFYRDASKKLTEDGLFCQRLGFIDFGPSALQVAARTMQAVFRDVVFLEMAGGEMLLIGTNSPQGVAREGFMDRLQKGHVRRQLAALGWDWSVPLNLSAFNHESLQKFAGDSPKWSRSANTSTNGTLAFRLPAEMMRWGPKPQEYFEAVAPLAGRFAQWGGIDPQDPDLLRRLAEVTGQRNLMVSHPDEFWAYRKSVKDQVTKRPRSVIVQVKGEAPRREIHRDEKRRLAYFQALGATLKHHPHRSEDIDRVESFAEPYDPLVTYFLHWEVAELHARAADRDYPAELAHRLHSVFFAAPGDRSVRNITSAIELLCEHPAAAKTPAERWDHLNSLLQMMKLRWAIRAGLTPASAQLTLNDVDKSLAAVHTALLTMDEIQTEAGVPAADWQARRRFLEATIVHPLRGYRRSLLPFHERERIIKEQKESASEG